MIRTISNVQLIRHRISRVIYVLGVCYLVFGQADAQRIPGERPHGAALIGQLRDQEGHAIRGATVRALNKRTQKSLAVSTNGEGIFRLRNLPTGDYEISVDSNGINAAPQTVTLTSNRITTVDVRVTLAGKAPAILGRGASGLPGPARTSAPELRAETSTYPGLRAPQPPTIDLTAGTAEVIPTDAEYAAPEPYRWTVEVPEWQRYSSPGDNPYVKQHWYDPFNRNRWKGDYPVFGQKWFFNFTGTSITGLDLRRLPTPSNVGSERPGSQQFFGRDGQGFAAQTFRLSFDLFRGDTSFRPADIRVRFTPAVNLNYLQTQERGIVNVNVAEGTNRFDTRIGLQEGFVEFKLRDLSSNFDFVSVRTGIQQFSSDFRGFIFSDEQPGVRVFGTLRSNRINYNLAYFYMLEKDTNSGLNTFEPRNQQVAVANIYLQDFLTKGYTAQFSFHFNRDDRDVHFDKNGFLVRPAPIGTVVAANGIPNPHSIRAYYLGWTGNGHIRKLNISHAFYQALGTDDLNPIAGRAVHINAQMAALELSVDKDWLRFRGSLLYSSGDPNTKIGSSRSGTARGFDSIVDDTHFAGTSFSFFDREGIRLTSTGVALVNPLSLLPDLRSNKEEGQSNFVNPGLRLYNLGVDADVSPKLRAFVNASYLQFDRTEPLQLSLFQSHVSHSLGTDFGVGMSYRPPLTENIVLGAGVSALVPGTGLRQIYTSRTLVSGFVGLRFQF